MSEHTSELERLAEADGATFVRSATGAWWAKDGITIVRGALSRAEAAVLYCEDRDLCGTSPEAILARIRHQYPPTTPCPNSRRASTPITSLACTGAIPTKA
jgi:hypothetical protein